MSDEKKKIGILTFHCSNNYGAVLQAYALCRTIQKIYKDSDVQVIDYRCEGTVTKTSFFNLKKKNGFVRALLHYRQINSINKKFDKFRNKYLNLSKTYITKDNLKMHSNDFDVIISGSDQVWNLTWSGNDAVYFQDFNENDRSKFSYAASFGFEKLDHDQIPFYKNLLQRFSKISVREESGKRIIEEQLGLHAEKHIDPTLLFSSDEWRKIAIAPKFKRKFILVYMVPKQKSVISYANRLSKETGLPILMLSKNFEPINAKHVGDSSPEEFVGWFEHAEYVVTNSFHGTAFSLIFHKKLSVELNNIRGLNIRSKDLLETCGIKSDVESDNSIIKIDRIDWEKVDQNLQRERVKSNKYLSTLLFN